MGTAKGSTEIRKGCHGGRARSRLRDVGLEHGPEDFLLASPISRHRHRGCHCRMVLMLVFMMGDGGLFVDNWGGVVCADTT